MNLQLTNIVNEARNGDRAQAVVSLRMYNALYPEDAEGWLALGALASDPLEARDALTQALELKPGWSPAHAMLKRLPEVPEPEITPTVKDETEPAKPDDIEEETVVEVDKAPANVDQSAFASLKEARAVLWPFAPSRRKKKSIGELLDSGAITRQDIAYAAEKARNEHVREASAYILKHTEQNLASADITPEQAAAIKWPYKQLNKPLGLVLRDKKVQTRDLRRAAFFAKEANLRQAARMALTGELDNLPVVVKQTEPVAKPKSPLTVTQKDRRTRFPMRIVNGDDYLSNEIRRREAHIRLMKHHVIGFGILGVLGLILIFVFYVKLWYVALLIALACAGGMFWLRKRQKTVQGEIGLFKQGLAAEVTVARNLREYLDDRWTLFRNVKLPGTNTDIDLVLLGPPGVFAIEIKAYKGTFRYKYDSFYRYSRRKWRSMRGNPGKQARATAGILHAYIGDVLHTDVWVEPKLVWAGPGALELVKPQVRVWYMNNLNREMERLKHLSGRLSTQKRAMVYGMLSGLSSMYETKRPD